MADDNVFDTRQVATELLKKYGSRKDISFHYQELSKRYGPVRYYRIIKMVKQLEAEEDKGAKKARQMERIAKTKELITQERERLCDQYKKGTRYAFIIAEKYSAPKKSVLKDKFGKSHYLVLPARYDVGDIISLVVRSVNVWAEKSGTGVRSQVELDLPKKLPDDTELASFVPIPPPRYKKSPSKWAQEVEGFDKHICGKPFTCSCCGRNFPARKGYRIDLKDIYFCMDCKREIYRPSGNGWSGRIIYTPMGNKR